MTECTGEDCANPTNLYLCGQCISDLQAWLDKVPDMMDELFTTMARLDATAPRNREGGDGMSTEPVMPVRVGALEVRGALRVWVEITTQGETLPLNAKTLAKDKYAGKFLPMLLELLAKAEHAIDNPMEKHVYGNCTATWLTDDSVETECGEELRAAPDAETTDCPNCGAHYDLNQLRAERKQYFRETPMPPREARETLQTQTGVKVSTITFKNWVNRHQLRYVLDRIGTGIKERRLYFPIDLLATHQKIRE
ncbi:hypothetical protein ACT3UQ_08810 [Glutamicibacter sp. AOP12-B1-11]|uniref:hypothetical protein n=1 Tax=Glutamicibacter sp. AOP12-B1-11 TaxID=3457725 RepID=UPI0040331981